MYILHIGEVLLEERDYGLRLQHGDTILSALSIANQHFAFLEVDILNAQRQTLRKAKSTGRQTGSRRSHGMIPWGMPAGKKNETAPGLTRNV